MSTRHRVKTTSCQDDTLLRRCRVKTAPCKNGIVSKQRRVKTAPRQNSVVPKRCRVKTMSCQTTSWQHGVVSRRHHVKTAVYQSCVVSTRHRIDKNALSERCRIIMSSCQHVTVPPRHLFQKDIVSTRSNDNTKPHKDCAVQTRRRANAMSFQSGAVPA